MCTSYYVITPKIFMIPTPQHASEPPAIVKQRFIDMLTNNRAARLAIRDAALGKGVLHLQPSRNPNANQVFATVLDAMIAYHMDQATKPTEADLAAPAGPATTGEAPYSDEPPTEGQPEPVGPAPDGGQTAEQMEAEVAAAFAVV